MLPNNQPSGNPNQSINQKKQAMIIFMVMISFVVILILYGDYGTDFSMIYFMVMPIIVLVGILMVASQKKRLAQNNPMNQNNPINQNSPPSQEIKQLPWLLPPSQNGAPISLNRSPEENRILADQAFEKINQMVKILIPVIIVVLIVVIIVLFGLMMSSDFYPAPMYLNMLAPIIIILVLVVFLKKGGLSKMKERMLSDPRLMSGQGTATQNSTSKPVNPVNQVNRMNQMNNTAASNLPLSKFNTMNFARVDTYAREDAKIKQQCPFCGKEFYGKRDSCPKCKKII